MARSFPQSDTAHTLLTMAAALNRVDSVGAAVDRCLETVETVFDHSVSAVFEYNQSTAETTLIGATSPESLDTTHDPPSEDVLQRTYESGARRRNDNDAEQTATDRKEPPQSEMFAPIGRLGVITVGSTERDRFDSNAVDILAGIAETLGTTVDRIERSDGGIAGDRQGDRNESQKTLWREKTTADADVTALRRLHELTLNSTDFDETVDRILSLGCEQFDLETGILSRITGTDYHIEAVVDTTGNDEQETVFNLNDTICEITVEQRATEPLAFADSADRDHWTHPAADDVQAYIGVPVVVDGETYGTVNFSSETPRNEAIKPGERKFVKLISQWLGTQIEQNRQLSELERYETIIEAVEDPVYALDTESRFTFVNDAAKRDFGYGQEILGKHVSVVMDTDDLERIRDQRKALAETDKRSMTAQFDLKTADEGRKIVETRHVVIGDEEFQGTAGMIRDVTEREARRRRLKSFQQAIEEAAEGVAILEDGEYVYADRTHVDMYGFDSPNQLLGESWRILYDDDETARIESEVFPKLKSDGYWRGTATGSRPDGTTFPTELSLTIVDDGRLVCTVRDITDRVVRKRELELKERAMDETNVSIQITDPTQDDNPLVYVNDGFEQITGYSREEALGRNPRFLQGPETDPEKTARLRAAIDAKEPVTMEVVNQRSDGTPYWAKLSVTPVYDDDGTLQNFIGIQQDVTDRRRLSETLEDRTERLELVLSGTGTGIAEWDLRTNELTWDETLTETFGHDPETIEEWREFVHSEDLDYIQAGLEKTIETGEPWSGAFRLTTGSGDLAWLESRCVPVYEDGEPVKILATGTDVTQRKQREQEQKATVEVLERVYQITTDPDRSFEQKVEGLLAAGSEYLDLPYGYLTNIKTENTESGTQTIVEAHGSHELLQPGESCPLPQSYCRKTIESDGLLTITNAAEAGWDSDPAYDVFNLETYIGGNVTADGRLYGTLCFVATEPREQSFSETEQSLINLFQRWIGYEIDREIAGTKRREQQERLDLVLSGTGTGIAEWDLRTDEVVWDETFQENFGRNPETLEAFTEIVHPDDRERVQEQLEVMIETGEQWDDAFRVITGSGEVAWYGVRAIPVCEDGKPVKVLATGSDVTERKQREQALAESRERYETLLQAAPDPVFVADDVTGEIVETNAAAAALRGESRAEIIGRYQTELHPSSNAEAYKAAITQAVECDGPITELSDGTQPKLCTVDGETIPVEITADTVDLPDGPVIYGVFRDVSDRIEKERELELKERAMDEASVGITISDPYTPDNPLVYVNEGFVDQTGYSREAVLGLNCRFLQGDDQDQPSIDTLREAVMDEEPITVDLRNYRRNGELFWNRLSVTPVYDDEGSLANYIGIQQDVTEEKLREQRLRALHQTTRELLQADGIHDAATVAADALYEELDIDLAGVYLCDGDALVQKASQGAVPEQMPERIERGRTTVWEAIKAGTPIVYNDVTNIDERHNWGELTTTAYFPLHDHGAVVVGAVDQTSLTNSDRKLIEVLTSSLVSVLDTLKRQRQLFEEREQFRLLIESVDEYAFIIVDEAGYIETWDQSAQNIFGYDAETAVGMSVKGLHPEPDHESGLSERLIQQARIAGESAHEGCRVRADGSEFYADTHFAPLETDDGEVHGYAMIVRDMTDRRRQERRTELFVEESDDVVSILEPDGTFSYVSGSSKRVLGHDPDDLVDENLFDYIHPSDRETVMEEFFSSTENPTSVERSECRFESGDGEWLNVDGRCQNMMAENAIDGMLLYLRDVTKDKQRARRLEAVFNGTFQFSGMLEPDGTIIDVNDAVVEFVTYGREEIVDRPLSEAPWWTQPGRVNDRIRDAVDCAADGEFVRFEIDVHGTDGVAHVDFSLRPVTNDDGEVALLIAEGRDITAFQQQRQHLEVIQRVMRHNMRNDLMKLRGWTEVLSTESDAEQRADHYERVERILDKWEKMNGDLKQIERALRSQQKTEAVTDLLPLVSELVSSQRDAYPDATVDVNASDVDPARIPATIRGALRELIDNAIRATDHPAPHVDVRLSRPNDNWVEIDVDDNGPGMPEMEAEVLETGEETPLNHGQGLGVWLVRMLVTQVGGDVSVDVTGDGTCVSLWIPTHHSPGGESAVV